MTSAAVERVADWLNEATPSDAGPAPAQWALVEIMGFRKHYGRISEVEKFGAKMLRVDVPVVAAAPLLGEPERFETFVYGGSAIFGITPMTEEACRKWHDDSRRPYAPVARLPAPDSDFDEVDEERPF